MSWLIVLSILAVLILFTTLYVAAEFAIVSARRSRLAQAASEGKRDALLLLSIVEDPRQLDTYVAACQIGITASSLTLGYYGQAALTPIISPLVAEIGDVSQTAVQSVVATGVLLFLTTLHVILGEVVPKNVGIQYPERLALLTAVPMRWSMAVFRPLIWFFNGSGQLILDLIGLTPTTEHAHIHSPDEIQLLVEESTEGGLLDAEEQRLLTNTLRLREQPVRQVMIPRTQILSARADKPRDELLELLADSPFSRLPLYGESIDDIVGVVHLKDLLCLDWQTGEQDVRLAMHAVPFVPATMSVNEVFTLLQRERHHVAIVLDEFGGTAGLVTIEDLVEEIFGELQDEFDVEMPPIEVQPNQRVRVRGNTPISTLNQILSLDLPDDSVHTIGGLMLSQLGYVPEEGEELETAGVTLRVESMDGKGVTAVSLPVPPAQLEHLKKISA
ncbi:MAG: hypothetical protein MAG451_01171 [Anaerolineales bacterium]|nr:hypothetical protein [Anaerolineales bacterium]